jgi:hypothetical protein
MVAVEANGEKELPQHEGPHCAQLVLRATSVMLWEPVRVSL